MAFKSKTTLDSFDKNNTSTKTIEFSALKTRTKGSFKKLASLEASTETPFHLLLDYFLDPTDKPLEHFLDIGTNLKLSKQFEQIEMKPGKPAKRMSASPKAATLGVVYIKEVNNKNTIHFKPVEKSKIPGGKWNNIIKALKPYLNGIPAIVILGEQLEASATENAASESPTTSNVKPETIAKMEDTMAKMEAELSAMEKALGITDLEKEEETTA